MTRLRSTPRQGLTLLEVLITIFVMAIGFLSVLTLFPLAARKIVRSIDSDRVNLMAANASGCESILGIRRAVQAQMDSEVSSPLLPSKIYHFDPIGSFGSSGWSPLSSTLWPNGIIPMDASNLSPGISINSLKEWLVSQDEITFEPWGLPEANFRKGNRYSVSFLYRRNTLADKNSLETVMLVYAGRSIEFRNETETQLTLLNPATSSDSTITIQDVTPALQGPGGPDRTFGRGAWLMDVSANLVSGQPRWKKFYQVQNVDSTVAGQLMVTLDRNLEADSASSTNVFPDPANAKLIWVDYLFDWFDRGIGP